MSVITDALNKAEKIKKAPLPAAAARQSVISPVPQRPAVKAGQLSPFFTSPFRIGGIMLILIVSGMFFITVLSKTVFSKGWAGARPAIPAVITPLASSSASNVYGSEAPAEAERYLPPELLLNGIMYSAKKPYVIINNNLLSVGDSLAGFTVTAISVDAATLEKDGQTTVIHLKK
ncbi:MAG: hypothetical protein PHS37_03685 [Candidatus Omnitrophica bacterium]|nr:hypothetical protein [Candidatus Omnitrophota bacterium]